MWSPRSAASCWIQNSNDANAGECARIAQRAASDRRTRRYEERRDTCERSIRVYHETLYQWRDVKEKGTITHLNHTSIPPIYAYIRPPTPSRLELEFPSYMSTSRFHMVITRAVSVKPYGPPSFLPGAECWVRSSRWCTCVFRLIQSSGNASEFPCSASPSREATGFSTYARSLGGRVWNPM